MTMELKLYPTNYLQVGGTSTKTLAVVPSSSGKASRVVVGDLDGVVTCFASKKNEAALVFKTLGGPPVERIELIQDRIFVATGTEVRGYSKKGKNFFTISTYMTDTIKTMCVRDDHIQVASEFLYTHYIENKDTYSYLSQAVIRDMASIIVPKRAMASLKNAKGKRVHQMPVLACADSMLRLIQGDRVLHHLDIPSPPTAICTLHDATTQTAGLVLIGMEDGNFALASFGRDKASIIWTCVQALQEPSITAIHAFDITGSGTPEVVIGRSNGAVEIYTFDEDGDVFLFEPPNVIYQTNVGSSITSLSCGRVSSKEFPEILVATYAGHVIGLRTHPSEGSTEARIAATQSSANLSQEEKTVLELRKEIKEMERELRDTSGDDSDLQHYSLPDLRYMCKFEFVDSLMCHLLSIESEISIDMVIIQATVPLDLLDIEGSTAVARFTPPHDTESETKVLGTYICTEGTTTFSVRVRSIEGQSGVLNVFLVPRAVSADHTSVAHKKQLAIHALSLHHITREPVDMGSLTNVLEIKGEFSLQKALSWLAETVPGLPAKLRGEETDLSFMFCSALLGTHLECNMQDGSIVLKSDNLSTVSIVKDTIAKFATRENTHIHIDEDIDAESCVLVLHRLIPVLESNVELARQVEILGTLKEIKAQEGGAAELSDEYQYILENSTEIMAKYNRQPYHLERLFGVVTDLFIDKCKAAGVNGKPHLVSLTALLNAHEFDELIPFFTQETFSG